MMEELLRNLKATCQAHGYEVDFITTTTGSDEKLMDATIFLESDEDRIMQEIPTINDLLER